MLSVSGARGIVGKTMTPVIAATFAGAFGSHIRSLTGGRKPRLVVARDGRFGGEALARAVQGALAATGCDVVVDGDVPTSRGPDADEATALEWLDPGGLRFAEVPDQ